MIVKPATSWLTTNSNPLLLNNCTVVLTMTAENVAIYDKPTPPLAEDPNRMGQLFRQCGQESGRGAVVHRANEQLPPHPDWLDETAWQLCRRGL